MWEKGHISALTIFCSLAWTVWRVGCASVVVADLLRASQREVERFTTKLPAHEHIELKYIQIAYSPWSHPEHLLKKLTECAKTE